MENIDINIEEEGEKKTEEKKNRIEKEKNTTKKLNTKNTGEIGNAKQIEEVVKITVSKEAEIQLLKVLDRVNNGFEAGRINRQELASWAIIQFAQECPPETIKAIRQDHFDEFSYLESILRKGKESGNLPLEIRNALKQQMGIDVQTRKPPKKIVAQSYTNDVSINDEKTTEMKMESE